MWGVIVSFLKEAVKPFEKYVGEKLFNTRERRFNPSCEKILIGSLVIALIVTFGSFFYACFCSDQTDVALLKNSKYIISMTAVAHDDPTQIFDNSTIDQVVPRSPFARVVFVGCVIVLCILAIALAILKYEKSSNAQLAADIWNNHMIEKKTDVDNSARNLLTLLLQSQKYPIDNPENWSLRAKRRKRQIELKLNTLFQNYINYYDKYCRLIVECILHRIRENEGNKADLVNVSLKAFVEDGTATKVLTLGRYMVDSHGTASSPVQEKSFAKLLEESYSVEDDTAMQYIISHKSDQNVMFICADTMAQRNNPNLLGSYKVPKSVARQIGATIVCPKIYREEAQVRVIGAICLDLTNRYEAWNDAGSFEENIIYFACTCIINAVQNSMKEIASAVELYQKDLTV